jgi:radical SAM protein with 4Fe4S-binding SPASM domain
MNDKDWQRSYLRLHPKAALKLLEQPYIYHISKDELYEIDDRAVGFFIKCDGTSKGEDLTTENDFVRYCLDEGLLETLSFPDNVAVGINDKIEPSLRYLELQLTDRCNLRCDHCYLGPSGSAQMDLFDAVSITHEFAAIGGLRLLISGGEPLLYRDLKEYIALTKDLKIRRVLFSNGTLINSAGISWLDVDEIQFSLDGWEEGHDALRGTGTFKKTIEGVLAADRAGIPISFSTMIHRKNMDQFDRMKEFIRNIGGIEWGVDVMSESGSLESHRELTVSCNEAVPFLDYAFGGGYHGASEGFACGRHLMTVMPDGSAAKCGFFRNSRTGDARNGLLDCWLRVEHIPLSRLECKECHALNECRGGCRFRAQHPLAPDPVMCSYYGIS